jgi:pyrroloquinoline quinone (PQQ) biosynthesis protein C
MHHKGRNKHHFEYWTDYNTKTKALEPVEMPLRYNIEMVCDRIAASKIYGGKDYHNGYALEYFNKGRARGFMHPATAELTGQLLTMLAEKGEKATFSYIRKLLREERAKCQRTR